MAPMPLPDMGPARSVRDDGQVSITMPRYLWERLAYAQRISSATYSFDEWQRRETLDAGIRLNEALDGSQGV